MRSPLRLRRASSAALVIGVVWAAGAFMMMSRYVANDREELLRGRANEAMAVVQSLAGQVESGFTALSTVVSQSGAGSFGPAATQAITTGASSGLALLRDDGHGPARILGRSGTLRTLPVLPGGALNPNVAAALARPGFQFAGVSVAGTDRILGVTMALPAMAEGSGFALYGEIRLPSSAEIIQAAPGAAFSDVDVAVYLGPNEVPGALLLTNTASLPLQGTRATVATAPGSTDQAAVNVGPAGTPNSHVSAGDLLLVVTAKGALGGTLVSMSPWLVAATILLTALLLAAVVDAALRRRDQALTHAAHLQTALVAVKEAERTFRRLFDDHPNPMWVYDLETIGFLAVNDAAVARYGYSRDEFMTMRLSDIRPPEDVEKLDSALRERRPVIERSGPWRHRLCDGRHIWVEITSHEQEFAERRAALVLAVDVTERVELEEQLRHQAFHDPLTSLANRALFSDRLEQAIVRGRRSGRECAVLQLDLDDFKAINDSLGHAAGDALLVEVAARLRAELRAADTAARLGGDEFAILLEDVDDTDSVVATAQRLVDELRVPYDMATGRTVTSVSMGVALTDDEATSAEDLMRRVDVAMYVAKAAGKGRCELYQRTKHLHVTECHALQNDLARAVSNGELSVVYQPQVDIRACRVVGVEALVRWNHPQRGPIGPDVFIPIAERSGVIHEIDEWVLETACLQVQRWADAGIPPMRVAVNVSGRDLEDDDRLVSAVARTLEETGIRPGDVEIELTESVAVAQHERALAILRRLRQLRVQVAIDDFGTGYSALSRLTDFTPDRIKIDRSFIADVIRDVNQRALVGAMIAMGHSIGLTVLAEGVETEDELRFLAAHGCDEVQGYLIGRPLPVTQLEEWLHDPTTIASMSCWPELRRLSTVSGSQPEPAARSLSH